MAITVTELNRITQIVNDDKTPRKELLQIIQQLVAAIRDHEARLVSGGL